MPFCRYHGLVAVAGNTDLGMGNPEYYVVDMGCLPHIFQNDPMSEFTLWLGNS
jgi:hypothetical protein